jgi:hypothetical protein
MEQSNKPNEEPPSDPETWSDEQWITWLKATDDSAELEHESDEAPVAVRLARSSAGQALGQAMLGLAQAMYGQKDEDLVMVVEGNSDDLDDEPFRVNLDFENPEQSTIVFRQADAERDD